MKTCEKKKKCSYVTIDYLDVCIDTIRAIDSLIARRNVHGFILTDQEVNYLKFASGCVRDELYEALLDKNK